MLIDGKEISKLAYKDIVNEIKIITKKIKRPPTLNIILIGENPSSLTYVNNKLKKCEEIGIKGNLIKKPNNIGQKDVLSIISELNADKKADGIILQLPIPNHLNERILIESINPLKDVDGLTATNIGLLSIGNPRFIPATAYGIMEILKKKKKLVLKVKILLLLGEVILLVSLWWLY